VLVEVAIDQIEPNPHQPRKTFESSSLEELTASIRASGVIQPIIVRQAVVGYQLIAGERRWRAARQAGLERIPAIVREATDAEAIELALVENLLRENLNPLEEADAYQRLMAQFGWTQEELAQRIGKDRASIANVLRLRRLPQVIQDDLQAGRLTMGHARALLGLPTPAAQLKAREEILAQDWSVRATEAGIRRLRRAAAPRGRRRAPDVEAFEEELRGALGTRVRVVGSLSRGRIELPYRSGEELERLHATLTDRHQRIVR
jgi:ParB family chromosome partitioning protein